MTVSLMITWMNLNNYFRERMSVAEKIKEIMKVSGLSKRVFYIGNRRKEEVLISGSYRESHPSLQA